jgi:hypothetical protein
MNFEENLENCQRGFGMPGIISSGSARRSLFVGHKNNPVNGSFIGGRSNILDWLKNEQRLYRSTRNRERKLTDALSLSIEY